jgi:hypothetical protein
LPKMMMVALDVNKILDSEPHLCLKAQVFVAVSR